MDRFRRLVNLTIVATFALIVIGGWVRVSDSGLGCGPPGSGTHGWPLCDGQVIPFLQGSTLIEFSHRFAAGVVVLAQAALGGATVENNLHEVLVATHLGLAMLLLALMIALRRVSTEPEEARVPEGATRGLRATALIASVLVL